MAVLSSRSFSVCTLLGALMAHVAWAADPATNAAATQGAVTSPAASPDAATRMQPLRDRMQQMRRTRDPAQRMQLMDQQMQQMEALMKDMDVNCPMAGKGGMGMMGGPGGGSMTGRGMGGPGMTQGDPMTMKRLDALEKRVDMMQMMLQQQRPGAPMRP